MQDYSEKVFDEFGVDKEKLQNSYKDGYGSKLIPKEWYLSIIKNCIGVCKNKPENININKNEKSVTLQFEDSKQPEKFELDFHRNLLSQISKYIQDEQKENPKYYHRGMVLETTQEGVSLTISY